MSWLAMTGSMPVAAVIQRETTGQFGQDSFGGGPGGGDTADDSKQITITGGTLVVDAGDGLDSNGNVTMSDGVVIVNGPTTGGNGAWIITGRLKSLAVSC